MEVYSTPIWMTVGSLVKAEKNIRQKNSPNSKKSRDSAKEISTPWVAAALASFSRRSPRRREISEFKPTPVPTLTAIIRFCTGKARETAVSACSPICAT